MSDNMHQSLANELHAADCPCCAGRRFEFLEAGDDGRCAVLCGRNAVQVRPARATAIDLVRMRERLANAGEFAMDDGRLVGAVMKLAGGKADAKTVNERIVAKLQGGA